MKFLKSISSSLNKLGLSKIPYILNNYYSLGRPTGPHNYLPLILMVLANGGEFRSKHRINYYNWVVVICHFSNMTHFNFILLSFCYLFISKFKSSFQGFCYVCCRLFIQGLWKGNYYCNLIAISWDPVMIFT